MPKKTKEAKRSFIESNFFLCEIQEPKEWNPQWVQDHTADDDAFFLVEFFHVGEEDHFRAHGLKLDAYTGRRTDFPQICTMARDAAAVAGRVTKAIRRQHTKSRVEKNRQEYALFRKHEKREARKKKLEDLASRIEFLVRQCSFSYQIGSDSGLKDNQRKLRTLREERLLFMIENKQAA